MPSPFGDYRQTLNPRYIQRNLAPAYVTEGPKPQLVHDASYEAALARAHRAAPGESAGDGLNATDWRQDRYGAKAPPVRPIHMATLAERVLAYLNKQPGAVAWSDLRDRLGNSGATIASGLARAGKIQRRRFFIHGCSGKTSQFLPLGRIWPKLPAGAHGAIYDTAGYEEDDDA